MAVKYRNMQQHPRQGSYIRQALTHSVLQTRENMTIKIEEKKNLHKENLEKIQCKERHLVAIQCTSSTMKNTSTHFALRIDMYQEQGVGLQGISTNLLISHVPTHALGTFHNHYQWSSLPIIMVSHSQFFRSKTQDQNSSDTQDQNSLETQYQNSIKKYQKTTSAKKRFSRLANFLWEDQERGDIQWSHVEHQLASQCPTCLHMTSQPSKADVLPLTCCGG